MQDLALAAGLWLFGACRDASIAGFYIAVVGLCRMGGDLCQGADSGAEQRGGEGGHKHRTVLSAPL